MVYLTNRIQMLYIIDVQKLSSAVHQSQIELIISDFISIRFIDISSFSSSTVNNSSIYFRINGIPVIQNHIQY